MILEINSLVKCCKIILPFVIMQYWIASGPSSVGIEVWKLFISQKYILLSKVKDLGKNFVNSKSSFI